jgi:hypothetical protein
MEYLALSRIGEIAAGFGEDDFRNRRASSGPIGSFGGIT